MSKHQNIKLRKGGAALTSTNITTTPTIHRGHPHLDLVLKVSEPRWRFTIYPSSPPRRAVSLTLHRNLGLSAVLFKRAQELDPIQKRLLDKIRDYNNRSESCRSSGGIVDAGPSYQKNVSEELLELQRGSMEEDTWPSFLRSNSPSRRKR
ncbi:ATP synthase-coupling factor 6, mitochondrial-like [Clinocottus analis]|uniref:ATP synthase-coupling factor 6, mitochondrial-like n=1 Tax=Clinocottus analis TaxID=304258 RepID=UPI0035C1DCD7